MKITFGPIPSRRLGSSLGVNHIPGKFCSYACVYCQAGTTRHLTRSRREFFHPEDVTAAIEAHLVDLEARKIHVDYLSFVPDGEPTLDIHLGEMLIRSRPFGLPVAFLPTALYYQIWMSLQVEREAVRDFWESRFISSNCCPILMIESRKWKGVFRKVFLQPGGLPKMTPFQSLFRGQNIVSWEFFV